MHVVLRVPQRVPVILDVRDTVTSVLNLVHDLTGTPPLQQVLLLQNFKPMTARVALAAYDLQEGDQIFLDTRFQLKGGSQDSRQNKFPPEDQTPVPAREQTNAEWGQMTIEGIIERTEEMESHQLSIRTQWSPLPDGTFVSWFENNYDLMEYYNVTCSQEARAIRVITVGERREGIVEAYVRYFTIGHVWAIQITEEHRSHWTWMEEVEVSPEARDRIEEIIQRRTSNTADIDIALSVRSRMGGKSAGELTMGSTRQHHAEDGATDAYTGRYGRKAENGLQCPICEGQHSAKWRSQRHDGSIRMTCPAGGGTNAVHLPEELRMTLFGTWTAYNTTPLIVPQREEEKDQETTHTHPRGPRPRWRVKATNRQEPGAWENDQITVTHWNSDKRLSSQQTMNGLMLYLNETRSDVVCLQEIETTHMSAQGLEEQGWELYLHSPGGKVAILVRADTAGRIHKPNAIWRSDRFESMTITLLLREGTLVIGTAYLPSGLDSKARTHTERLLATEQHMEINHRALCHDYAILTMDANETTTPEGRVTTHHPPEGLRTTPSSACKNRRASMSTMACYTSNMRDCDIHCNPQSYDERGEPRSGAFTHSQPLAATSTTDLALPLSQSKIDYIWASKNLLNNKTKLSVDAAPATWRTGPPRKNFHSTMTLAIPWPGAWRTTTTNTIPHKTKPLRQVLNMHKLDATNREEIVRKIEAAFATLDMYGRLKRIRQDKARSSKSKAAAINKTFHDTLMAVGKEVLGERAECSTHNTRAAEIEDKLAKWDEMHNLIGAWLIQNDKQRANPQPLESVPQALADTLNRHGAAIPVDYKDRRKWWKARDHNRARFLNMGADCLMTDARATTNRKRFVRQFLHPHSTTRISTLTDEGELRTTDSGIKEGLHNFLTRLAGSPEPRVRTDWAEYEHDKDLESVTSPTSLEELELLIPDLDPNSAAGELPTALVKLATTGTYEETVPKTRKEMEREMRAEKAAAGHAPIQDAVHTETHVKPTKVVTRRPRRALRILAHIINYSLEARTIPASEKQNVVTGLPKGEGQVTDTAKMRPISVGPVVGKLINKLVATRLGAALVKYGKLDPAQFAFLPGRSIHEAISSIIACFRQSNSAKPGSSAKACYAVYYDISKAYDNVRWSSIENALQRIGAPRALVDFVIKSLEGTTLKMKTGKPGGMTEAVQIHRAIKQGCPLAPLLFVLVMDELHAGYRKIGGYQLEGGEVVSSRGYCDDTVILAQDLPTLRRMNNWTHKFFTAHGLQVNTTKSVVTGRHKNGKALRSTLEWPGNARNMALAAPWDAVRYLGLRMNMDCTWDEQIGKMNALVMTVVTALNHGRLTALQAGILVREVLGAKLEIGLRHAQIPQDTLKGWDTWLSAAVCANLGLRGKQIHKTSVFTILATLPIEDLALTVRTIQLLESATKGYELQEHYRRELDRGLRGELTDTRTKTLLSQLETKGLTIHRNTLGEETAANLTGTVKIANEYQPEYIAAYKHTGRKGGKKEFLVYWTGYDTPTWCTPADFHDSDLYEQYLQSIQDGKAIRTGDISEDQLQDRPHGKPLYRPEHARTHRPYLRGPTAQYGYIDIPTRTDNSYELWGHDFRAPKDVMVTICTDGSTYPGKPSGAGFVFADDHMKEDEYKPKGQFWKIEESDNYLAELAAINKAIRATPVTVDITIHTDSNSSVQAIQKALRGYNSGGPALLNQAGRPYITAACEAILHRGDHGATTTLRHVAAHTGIRDTPSLGNSMADRMAKKGALEGEYSDVEKMKYELPYLVGVATDQEDAPVAMQHGNTRRAIRDRLKYLNAQEWGRRENRGALIRTATGPILALIKDAWTNPSTDKIKFMLGILNQADDARRDHETGPEPCKRCHQEVEPGNRTLHRTLVCPAIADLWNTHDDRIAELLQTTEWGAGSTNETERRITTEVKNMGSGTRLHQVVLFESGQTRVEVYTGAVRATARLLLAQNAYVMMKDQAKAVREVTRIARDSARSARLWAREAAEQARAAARATDRVLGLVGPFTQRTFLNIENVRQGDSLAMLGAEEALWLARVTGRDGQKLQLRWMNVQEPNNEGGPIIANWSDHQQTTLGNIQNKTIIQKVQWVWDLQGKGHLTQEQWRELKERWWWSRLRHRWAGAPKIRLKRHRPPQKSTNRSRRGRDGSQIQITGFLRGTGPEPRQYPNEGAHPQQSPIDQTPARTPVTMTITSQAQAQKNIAAHKAEIRRLGMEEIRKNLHTQNNHKQKRQAPQTHDITNSAREGQRGGEMLPPAKRTKTTQQVGGLGSKKAPTSSPVRKKGPLDRWFRSGTGGRKPQTTDPEPNSDPHCLLISDQGPPRPPTPLEPAQQVGRPRTTHTHTHGLVAEMAVALATAIRTHPGTPTGLEVNTNAGVELKPLLDRVCQNAALVNSYCEESLEKALLEKGAQPRAVAVTASNQSRTRGPARGIAVVLRSHPDHPKGYVTIAMAHKTDCPQVKLLPVIIAAARSCKGVIRLVISPMQGREGYLTRYYTDTLGFRMWADRTDKHQPILIKLVNRDKEPGDTEMEHQTTTGDTRHRPKSATGTTGNSPTAGCRAGDPDPMARIDVAGWLQNSCEEDTQPPRGLFAQRDIPRKNAQGRKTVITQYAGYLIDRGDARGHMHCPIQTAYYYPDGNGQVIDGFREPRQGYGLAQFCNDPIQLQRKPESAEVTGFTRDTGKVNCELVHSKEGVVLVPKRDIQAGQELMVSYDDHYWHRLIHHINRGTEGRVIEYAEPIVTTRHKRRRTTGDKEMEDQPPQISPGERLQRRQDSDKDRTENNLRRIALLSMLKTLPPPTPLPRPPPAPNSSVSTPFPPPSPTSPTPPKSSAPPSTSSLHTSVPSQCAPPRPGSSVPPLPHPPCANPNGQPETLSPDRQVQGKKA